MKAAISGETSNLRHPQCLALMATAAEIDWARCDALLAECGPASATGIHDKSSAAFDCHCPWTRGQMSRWRILATRFPPERRHLELGMTLHTAARTADRLDMVIAANPKGSVTREVIIRDLKEFDAEARAAKRDKKLREAQTAEAAANRILAVSSNKPARTRSRHKSS